MYSARYALAEGFVGFTEQSLISKLLVRDRINQPRKQTTQVNNTVPVFLCSRNERRNGTRISKS